MKFTYLLFACLISLSLFIGCGDSDESSDAVSPLVSAQELPADDDIEGLYNLGIPRGWYMIKDPVLYVKYYRAKLLRQFGNIPEVHIIADMELKRRQWIYPTRDEEITYLEALYKFWSNKGTLESLESERKAKAEGRPFVMIYADAPAEHIIKRLEEIYQRKLSRKEAIIEVALIKGDRETLEAFGWKVEAGDPNKEIDPDRFVDKFVPGGGIRLEEDEPDADELEEEDKPDE